mmetsp:Transcript_11524/g.22933  ORF Transcript_11524/g.22933 Transcript_11524/m.22933 type:complete len:268 (+) Transcript_11524:2849-3652(+)
MNDERFPRFSHLSPVCPESNAEGVADPHDVARAEVGDEGQDLVPVQFDLLIVLARQVQEVLEDGAHAFLLGHFGTAQYRTGPVRHEPRPGIHLRSHAPRPARRGGAGGLFREGRGRPQNLCLVHVVSSDGAGPGVGTPPSQSVQVVRAEAAAADAAGRPSRRSIFLDGQRQAPVGRKEKGRRTGKHGGAAERRSRWCDGGEEGRGKGEGTRPAPRTRSGARHRLRRHVGRGRFSLHYTGHESIQLHLANASPPLQNGSGGWARQQRF